MIGASEKYTLTLDSMFSAFLIVEVATISVLVEIIFF